MKIIIDGYNLLHAYYTGFSAKDPQAIEVLLDVLVNYKKVKSADITLVLDGTEGIYQGSHSYTEKGIKIIYSARGKTADEKIRDILKGKVHGVIVISSDRKVKENAEKAGAVCADSEFFATRLTAAFMKEIKGSDEDEKIYLRKSKKGPSRRKKKKERKKDKIIPNL